MAPSTVAADGADNVFEFVFDVACPYAYIASRFVETVAARHNFRFVARPVLLGGLINANASASQVPPFTHPSKKLWAKYDIERFAALRGVPMRFHPEHPRRSVNAMRCILEIGARNGGDYMPIAHRLYRAYWVDNLDIAQDATLIAVLSEFGIADAAGVLRAAKANRRDELRTRTDEAIARGCFGVPTMFLNTTESIYGQDMLAYTDLRCAAIAAGGVVANVSNDNDITPVAALSASECWPYRTAPTRQLVDVDFYFDYSSPFSYIASTRVESVFGRGGVNWKPFLLGALFKHLGGPKVPMTAMSSAKYRNEAFSLKSQAQRAGVVLNWNSHFPLTSVLPLRITLIVARQHPDKLVPLAHRFFKAVWVEDANPKDQDAMAACCDDVGLSGAVLVAQSSDPAVKQELRTVTARVYEDGLFGAPAFVVPSSKGDGASFLFWGDNRLEMAHAAACGDERACIGAMFNGSTDVTARTELSAKL